MGFGRIFLVIFVFALLEVVVLGQVAESIGWGVTILLTVLTAMAGSLMFRWQGVETWVRLNHRLQKGEMPGNEMVEGVMLLLGGALLITPGFITDAIGFLLLVPQTRKAMAGAIVKKGMMQAFTARNGGQSRAWVYQRTYSSGASPNTQSPPNGPTYRADPQPTAVRDDGRGHLIIDGEAEIKDDSKS